MVVRKRLTQGDPLPALLFNLVLEAVLRESGIRTDGQVQTSTCRQRVLWQYHSYGKIQDRIRESFGPLEEKAVDYALKINGGRTK